MKNLMKTAGEALNVKFVWQNNHSAESLIQDIPEIAKLKSHTKERLLALSNGTKYSIAKLQKMTERIIKKSNTIQPLIQGDLIDGDTTSAAKRTKISGLSHEENNMVRTEIVSRINDNIDSLGISDNIAAEFFLKTMEEMSYPPETSSYDKLYRASRMIKYGDTLSPDLTRNFTGNADDMEKSSLEFVLDGTGVINIEGIDYLITDLEILTGAAMTEINTRFTNGFRLEKAIFNSDKSQILCFMKNGCRGNVVIIDLQENRRKENHPEGCIDGKLWVHNGNGENWHQIDCGGDVPEPINGCDIDCNDKAITEREGTTEESRNKYQETKERTDKNQEAINKEYEKFWNENDGLLKEFRNDLDGAFMEGGAIGLLQGLLRKIGGKYKIESDEYKMMEERIFSAIRMVEAGNKTIDSINKSNKSDVWKKNREYLVSDIITTGIGMALGGGFGSIVLTNIKLPKRIFGSQLSKLPGMNDVLKEISIVMPNGSTEKMTYTKAFNEYRKNLHEERLSATNSMKTEAGENIGEQNIHLTETLSGDFQTRINSLIKMLKERTNDLEGEAGIGKRASKFAWFSGNRKKINESRKILEDYQENPSSDKVSTEKVTTAMNDMLKLFTKEFNKDFKQNLSFDGLGKQMENDRIMDFNFRGSDVQVKLQTLEKIVNGNPEIIVSWNHNITIDGVEYGQPGPDGTLPDGVINIDSIKDIKGKEGKHIRKIYRKTQRKLKKIIPRLAMIEELHWMSTQIEDLAIAKDVREVDKLVVDQETKESIEKNVESTSDYSRITFMERLYNENPEDVKNILKCYFEKSGDLITAFFETKYDNAADKKAAWDIILNNADFSTEMSNYRTAVKKAIKNGTIYNENGEPCFEDIYEQFKAGKRFYYDAVVGEKSYRLPITFNMLQILKEKFKDIVVKKEIPKDQAVVDFIANNTDESGVVNLEAINQGFSSSLPAGSTITEVTATHLIIDTGATQRTVSLFGKEVGGSWLKDLFVGNNNALISGLDKPIVGAIAGTTGAIIQPHVRGEGGRSNKAEYTVIDSPENNYVNTNSSSNSIETRNSNTKNLANSLESYLNGYSTDLKNWDFSQVETNSKKVAGIKSLSSTSFEIVFKDKSKMKGRYILGENGEYKFIPKREKTKTNVTAKNESVKEKIISLPIGFSSDLAKYSNLPENALGIKRRGLNLTVFLKNGQMVDGKWKAVTGTTIRQFVKNPE